MIKRERGEGHRFITYSFKFRGMKRAGIVKVLELQFNIAMQEFW